MSTFHTAQTDDSATLPRGRPSVAEERRRQILDAVVVCIVRHGLGQTTLGRIATEAGLTRSSLAHFIGNRDDIIDAALEGTVTRFLEEFTAYVDHLSPADRLPAFLDSVLDDTPAVVTRSTLLNELFAAAGHDEHARNVVGRAVVAVDEWIEQMMVDRYPDADPYLRRAIAATVPLALREYDRTRSIGAAHRGPALGVDVRAVIDLLLAQLGPPAGTPDDAGDNE